MLSRGAGEGGQPRKRMNDSGTQQLLAHQLCPLRKVRQRAGLRGITLLICSSPSLQTVSPSGAPEASNPLSVAQPTFALLWGFLGSSPHLDAVCCKALSHPHGKPRRKLGKARWPAEVPSWRQLNEAWILESG